MFQCFKYRSVWIGVVLVVLPLIIGLAFSMHQVENVSIVGLGMAVILLYQLIYLVPLVILFFASDLFNWPISPALQRCATAIMAAYGACFVLSSVLCGVGG